MRKRHRCRTAVKGGSPRGRVGARLNVRTAVPKIPVLAVDP